MHRAFSHLSPVQPIYKTDKSFFVMKRKENLNTFLNHCLVHCLKPIEKKSSAGKLLI
jgi:hypothetical protein